MARVTVRQTRRVRVEAVMGRPMPCLIGPVMLSRGGSCRRTG
jgi:hypothetical protein